MPASAWAQGRRHGHPLVRDRGPAAAPTRVLAAAGLALVSGMTAAVVSLPVLAQPAPAQSAPTQSVLAFKPVDPGQLASHRAVYDVRLAEREQQQDFSQAEGRLIIEWQNVCSGYTLNQRLVTEFIPFEGETLLSDLRFSSWEGSNGDQFRFTLKNYFNGALREDAVGTADRKEGRIAFESPDQDPVDLSSGVVFPTEMTALILGAAQAGERFVRRTIFDGAEDGESMAATAFIGRQRAPLGEGALEGVSGGDVLGALPSWPVTLSYFEMSGETDLPDYQVAFQLYPNGLSNELELRYDAFSLAVSLKELTLLETPDCTE